MIGILGKKVGMTQVFIPGRGAVPVTVIEAAPGQVTQTKTAETDGYSAIQVGWRPTDKQRRIKKAQVGHFKKAGTPYFTRLREFRLDDVSEYAPGQEIGIEQLSEIAFVDVIGDTKGRGFQGVVKRYGFSGGPKTHGSKRHRVPGSIGMCAWPGHTIKGKKLPGHMGMVRRTVQNLEVIEYRPEERLILIRGSVPGHRNGWVLVQPAAKGGGRRGRAAAREAAQAQSA